MSVELQQEESIDDGSMALVHARRCAMRYIAESLLPPGNEPALIDDKTLETGRSLYRQYIPDTPRYVLAVNGRILVQSHGRPLHGGGYGRGSHRAGQRKTGAGYRIRYG